MPYAERHPPVGLLLQTPDRPHPSPRFAAPFRHPQLPVGAQHYHTNNHIPYLLDEACEQGVIKMHEAYHAERADIVICGRDADNQPAYTVVEASVTAENRDIFRAQGRAGIISRATVAPAIAAVCGALIDDATTAPAAQYDVRVINLPD